MIPLAALVRITRGEYKGAVGQVAQIDELDDDLKMYHVAFSRTTLAYSNVKEDVKLTIEGETEAFRKADLKVITPK